jgi:hypothetical protein
MYAENSATFSSISWLARIESTEESNRAILTRKFFDPARKYFPAAP